jgi:hypothetical protein
LLVHGQAKRKLTLPVASGNATETQDVLNNGLPEILAGLSDT